MHSRRIACLFLGIWFGGAVLMAWVNADRRHAAEQSLLQPGPVAAAHIRAIGRGPARDIMNYVAEEQQRWYSEAWGTSQVVWALLFFAFLLFGTSQGKLALGVSLAMLAITVVERAVLSPQIAEVGQAMDFVADPSAALRDQMRVWGYGYALAEIVKWALGLSLAGSLIWHRSSRSFDSRQQVDPVYKTNYRHIDG